VVATRDVVTPNDPTTRAACVVVVLSLLIAVLTLPAATVGLFWGRGDGAFTVATVRGETVELFGRGLYRYDTLFAAGAAHGTDAVTLLLAVPMLLTSTVLYRRGALRWRLLHTGVLVYFLYIYGSVALGTVAFNPLFPLYVLIFSASLFAAVLSFASVDRIDLARHTGPPMPRRGLAAFLIASGVITLVVWGLPLATAVASGGVTERLDSYTTEVTFALDLASITPLTVLAGVLVLRRAALGYQLAMSLLVLETLLAPLIAAQTAGQHAAGVRLGAGEVVGPILGFVVLAAGAAWFTLRIARHAGGSQASIGRLS
jgi:hypothetical protein